MFFVEYYIFNHEFLSHQLLLNLRRFSHIKVRYKVMMDFGNYSQYYTQLSENGHGYFYYDMIIIYYIIGRHRHIKFILTINL